MRAFLFSIRASATLGAVRAHRWCRPHRPAQLVGASLGDQEEDALMIRRTHYHAPDLGPGCHLDHVDIADLAGLVEPVISVESVVEVLPPEPEGLTLDDIAAAFWAGSRLHAGEPGCAGTVPASTAPAPVEAQGTARITTPSALRRISQDEIDRAWQARRSAPREPGDL